MGALSTLGGVQRHEPKSDQPANICRFFQKPLKSRPLLPNHDHDTPILAPSSGHAPVLSAGVPESKDKTMSNDITPSKLPPAPAAVAAAQPTRAAEVAKPQPVEAPKPAPEAKPDPRETRRAMEETSEQLNQQMQRNSRDLSFSVDDVANKVVLTVKNKESGEVIRQIPSEAALRVAHNLDDMKGLLQDQKS